MNERVNDYIIGTINASSVKDTSFFI